MLFYEDSLRLLIPESTLALANWDPKFLVSNETYRQSPLKIALPESIIVSLLSWPFLSSFVS